MGSLLRFLGGLLVFPQQSFAGLLVACRWSSGSSWSHGCIDGFDIPAESCRRHALSMFVQAISELHCILCSPLNEELHIKLDNNSGPDIGCQLHGHHGDIGHLNRNPLSFRSLRPWDGRKLLEVMEGRLGCRLWDNRNQETSWSTTASHLRADSWRAAASSWPLA